jgi:pimeloyl-ACP methyl ester carboxylesterase
MPFLVAAAATVALTAPGPKGPLAGTWLDAGGRAPVVLIVPGSGPTDRDGNNPRGVTAAPYRLLAEALAGKGVSTVRIDKRGMFGSKSAIVDPNAVTIGDYAADVHSWARVIRHRMRVSCVWLLGHSEGGLVALASAQQQGDVCGVILVSAPGRRMGDILREQLRANPANAPLMDQAMGAIDTLERGERVNVSSLHPALQALFAPQIQPFLIDMMSKDPQLLAAKVAKPLLILTGARDIQVSEVDAKALAAAQPQATLRVIPAMNHVLKEVAGDDRTANLKTYADPSLPVNATLVETIAAFVKAQL